MSTLPVIVGLGGINPAGRSSGFHSYKRIICDALSHSAMEATWLDLANRMQLSLPNAQVTPDCIEQIKAGTLIRKITQFNPEKIPSYHTIMMQDLKAPFCIELARSALPTVLPESWRVETLTTETVRVHLAASAELLLPSENVLDTFAAGSLPENFEPGRLYPSTHHPRALRLAVYGASDALNSLGLDWQSILKHISPDEVSVYAGGALTQADPLSLTGLVTQFVTGKSFNSKMMAFSFSEMPADFINSYILQSVGTTGTSIGACATFLYNLKQGIQDIQHHKSQVAIIGCADAAITPEVISAFSQMKALASNKKLAALDGLNEPDFRRACRPFSDNAGFVISESAQFIVLMSDTLALKTGANILGSVGDVFVHADANKKSITSPGVGNYITMMKATTLAKNILGQNNLDRTYVQAHGSSTPQNRVTESHILNETAKVFGIKHWQVCAVKAYLGHSISVASGDQVAMSLGVWQSGYLPGIKTIDHIANDVHHTNLSILMEHQFVGEKGEHMLGTIINSKGFGGNNASALLLSPEQTKKMLAKKHGRSALVSHEKQNEIVQQHTDTQDKLATAGKEKMTYDFAKNVMDENDVTLHPSSISLRAFDNTIALLQSTPYEDYLG